MKGADLVRIFPALQGKPILLTLTFGDPIRTKPKGINDERLTMGGRDRYVYLILADDTQVLAGNIKKIQFTQDGPVN